MSLYGKYRPQNFANLVGQDHVRLTLLHEITTAAFAHAYLFTGPRGTGKTSTARLIAKALNCDNKNIEGEPCDECDLCKNIKEGSLIDVIEIDAASNRGIDEIRDLKEKINFAPSRAKTKTYIIDEVHMLTKEAFNALLKTLEEPPENVYFILCTTEIHKIPETIISRCQRFDFKRIEVKTIMTRLSYIAQTEGVAAEDAAIELIARHVEGGLRDAIGLFEQMTIDNKLTEKHVREHLGITGHQTIQQLISVLEKQELPKALHIINEVHNEGYDLTSFMREILECLRQQLMDSIAKGQGQTKLWLEMIMRFEEAREMMRNAAIPQLPLEIAAIRICGDAPITEVVKEENKVAQAQVEEPSLVVETSKNDTEAQTAATLKQEFELEDGGVTKHWLRVVDQLQPPSLRRSLTTGKVSGENNEAITITFASHFHMEKVNTAESRVKIEKIIQELFGKKLKVECELNVATASPTAEPKAESKKLKEKGEEQAAGDSSKNLAKKALEMFGE